MVETRKTNYAISMKMTNALFFRARDVEDILIASIDGLKDFPEAIADVFPKTEIQLCIVHQIRNSLKYIVSKEQKVFMADLKLIYRASSKELAEHHLLELGEKWGKKYPAVMKSWNTNWENLSQYFKYPDELRRIIYTTNIVEGFHRQIRKYTKNKGAFTSENALLKLIYCACPLYGTIFLRIVFASRRRSNQVALNANSDLKIKH